MQPTIPTKKAHRTQVPQTQLLLPLLNLFHPLLTAAPHPQLPLHREWFARHRRHKDAEFANGPTRMNHQNRSVNRRMTHLHGTALHLLRHFLPMLMDILQLPTQLRPRHRHRFLGMPALRRITRDHRRCLGLHHRDMDHTSHTTSLSTPRGQMPKATLRTTTSSPLKRRGQL